MLLLIAAALGGGCSTVAYYGQAVHGQLGVMAASRPIDEVLADGDTLAAVQTRLARLPELRRFAVGELGLADSRSYRSYADLGREAMVWSIVATPVDAFEPRQWCYPVLGCASYRGYFERASAQQYADELAAAGWDVAVEPVPAYSTLGWFADPLPSTVIQWPLADIAALLFHELAHETLYLQGDSAFNEAYATLIEREGVRRWLARHGSDEQRQSHARRVARRGDFLGLLRRTRGRLADLYAADLPRSETLQRKQALFAELGSEYAAQKAAWDGYSGYDRWFGRPLNNAHLASVGTYNALVPAFRQLLFSVGGDMRRFHVACRELAELPPAQRAQRLEALANAD